MTDLEITPLAAPNPATTDWVPIGGAPGAIPYGTSLPASPYDGQTAILVDSTTNPTYQWQFRYNAGSTSPYKWEFVGGAPAHTAVEAVETTAGTIYGDLATVGPTFTLPRGGDFLVLVTCYLNPASGANASVTLDVQGTTVGDLIYGLTSAGTLAFDSSIQIKLLGKAAGNTVRPLYKVSSGTGTFARRRLTVTPIRVS